jgi:hypothetical protein
MVQTKLTNLQLELLKMFQFTYNDDQVLEIKNILADYFADKAIELADNEWKARGYTNETMDKWIFEEV